MSRSDYIKLACMLSLCVFVYLGSVSVAQTLIVCCLTLLAYPTLSAIVLVFAGELEDEPPACELVIITDDPENRELCTAFAHEFVKHDDNYSDGAVYRLIVLDDDELKTLRDLL